MAEDALLTDRLELTNEPSAIAKIADIKLCERYNNGQHATSHCLDYGSIMPTNLYGPGDNCNHQNSHILPTHDAREAAAPSVLICGTSTPKREFLYVADVAATSIYVMLLDSATYQAHTQPMQSHINVGSRQDLSIVELVKSVVGCPGRIDLDATKPHGPCHKLMDVSLLTQLGWQARSHLQDGVRLAYQDFLKFTAPPAAA